jgi:hypothetical protein
LVSETAEGTDLSALFVHRQELVDLVGYIVGMIVVQVPVPIEGE